MPVYEYCCDACGERFEPFLRSTTQRAAPVCPKCGSPNVRKSISLFGVGSSGSAGAGRATAASSCGPGPV